MSAVALLLFLRIPRLHWSRYVRKSRRGQKKKKLSARFARRSRVNANARATLYIGVLPMVTGTSITINHFLLGLFLTLIVRARVPVSLRVYLFLAKAILLLCIQAFFAVSANIDIYKSLLLMN